MRKRRQYHELVIPSYGSRRNGVVYQSVGSWLHQNTVFYMESCCDYVYRQCERNIYEYCTIKKKELFYVQIMSMAYLVVLKGTQIIFSGQD